MSTKIITGFLIIIVLLLGFLNVYIYKNKKSTPNSIPNLLSTPAPSYAPSTNSPRVEKKPNAANNPSATPKQLARATVTISNFSANPDSVKAKAPVLVTWTNKDKEPHTIQGASWESMELQQNRSFSQIFEVPGNYSYQDPKNPQIKGWIIVE